MFTPVSFNYFLLTIFTIDTYNPSAVHIKQICDVQVSCSSLTQCFFFRYYTLNAPEVTYVRRKTDVWHQKRIDVLSLTWPVAESYSLCKMEFASSRWIVTFACLAAQGVIHAVSLKNSTTQGRPLYIGSMAPMTGRRAWWGAGIPLAIEMAFEDINKRSDILKEYKLSLVQRDTEVVP